MKQKHAQSTVSTFQYLIQKKKKISQALGVPVHRLLQAADSASV